MAIRAAVGDDAAANGEGKQRTGGAAEKSAGVWSVGPVKRIVKRPYQPMLPKQRQPDPVCMRALRSLSRGDLAQEPNPELQCTHTPRGTSSSTAGPGMITRTTSTATQHQHPHPHQHCCQQTRSCGGDIGCSSSSCRRRTITTTKRHDDPVCVHIRCGREHPGAPAVFALGAYAPPAVGA